MLSIRNAVLEDLDVIMAIYKYAQEYMIHSGNPTQWGRSYPTIELIESDIRAGVCRILYDEAGIHGVFALFDTEEPTYKRIENGQWLNEEAYLTIHRIAGDGVVHGIFQAASDYCKAMCSNVRIDTHADNQTMQHQIEKNGFIRCGIIYVRDGSPRIAYQWRNIRDGVFCQPDLSPKETNA